MFDFYKTDQLGKGEGIHSSSWRRVQWTISLQFDVYIIIFLYLHEKYGKKEMSSFVKQNPIQVHLKNTLPSNE